ncbi:ABC transporter ATP-binding protein [Clostridium sediminicola]|uniref:metal ABC transporter ATP-binding protein n=1 Tax=Clostridium sediminicola TaxID=3114879 RepID=UPI0031F225BE
MAKVIELKKVNVFYKDICALENINLSIEEKEFLAILGPNGGGKSTLLKLLLGIVKKDSGLIEIFGEDPKNIKNKIGYVPQYTKFNKKFPINVRDVILMGGLKPKIKPFYKNNNSDLQKVDNVMKELNIYHLRKRQIGQLSGGQLQKVLIARALFMNPQILLLDEPTASLDGGTKTQIYSLLKKLNEKMTVIIVTHDYGVVNSYVKNIACLNKTLYYHGEKGMNEKLVEAIYGCPVDLIAHGVPHRVLGKHREGMY